MTETVPTIVHVPNRGLRCRELSCQTEIVLVATTRGRRMPLERELVPYTAGDDERGLFVVLDAHRLGEPPTAYGLKAARELGVEIPELVYRAHWSACAGAASFRRRSARIPLI